MPVSGPAPAAGLPRLAVERVLLRVRCRLPTKLFPAEESHRRSPPTKPLRIQLRFECLFETSRDLQLRDHKGFRPPLLINRSPPPPAEGTGRVTNSDIAKLNGEIAEGYLENVDYGRAASS